MTFGKLIQNKESNAMMQLIVCLMNDMLSKDEKSKQQFYLQLKEHFPERDPADGVYPQYVLDLDENLIGLSQIDLPQLLQGNEELQSMVSDMTHLSMFITNRTKNLHPVVITLYGIGKLQKYLGQLINTKIMESLMSQFDDPEIKVPQVTFPAFYHYEKQLFVYIKQGQDVTQFD